MAGNVTSQEITQPPQAMPGMPSSYGDLAAEFPEIADQLMALNAWRDVGQFDYRSKAYYRIFPTMRPDVP